MLPLLWMVSTSLKVDAQVYRAPPLWFPWPFRVMNYVEAMQAQPFARFFLNTFNFAFLSGLGSVISGAVVAYGFSRIRWTGRDFMFYVCLATLMIPYLVTMIPLYIVFARIGWLNTYLPMIVPAYFGHPYYIFLLRQFFMGIPGELSDAARIDGASEIKIFVRIVIPLVKPALAVVMLLQFLWAWGAYLEPLIYLNDTEMWPLALGIERFRAVTAERLSWPYMMAASTVTIMPVIVIYYFTQRMFVEGITMTGIKG